MPAIAENKRISELRRLGVSEAIIKLASGDCLHELFRHRCLGPPHYVYHGAGTPDGPPMVPLWDSGDTVTAIWERGKGIEFIEFSIESHNEYTLIARTEQGFWTAQFDFFYECEASLAELHEGASRVGFRFLDRHLESRVAAEDGLRTFEDHKAWLRDLVASIDRDAEAS